MALTVSVIGSFPTCSVGVCAPFLVGGLLQTAASVGQPRMVPGSAPVQPQCWPSPRTSSAALFCLSFLFCDVGTVMAYPFHKVVVRVGGKPGADPCERRVCACHLSVRALCVNIQELCPASVQLGFSVCTHFCVDTFFNSSL